MTAAYATTCEREGFTARFFDRKQIRLK